MSRINTGTGWTDVITAATPADVTAAIDALIDAAPGTLDTLNELAAALGDDPNFATTITTALAGKQPLDSDLTAIAALTTTSYGRAFLELVNAAAGRTALGLGTAATSATGDFDAAGAAAAAQAASQPLDSDLTAIAALSTTSFGRGLLALADAAALRTSAGLVLGTDIYSKTAVDSAFQPLDTDLTQIAGLASAANKVPYATGSGAWALADFTAAGRALVDDADAAAQRTTLGLGTLATASSLAALSTAVPQTAHGFAVGDVVYLTGATTYAKAKADAVGTAEVAGIVSAVADANNFTLHHRGKVTGLSGLTAATVYFLSPTTAGLLTATEPTTTGHVRKPVLVADSTTSGFWFNYEGVLLGTTIDSLYAGKRVGRASTTSTFTFDGTGGQAAGTYSDVTGVVTNSFDVNAKPLRFMCRASYTLKNGATKFSGAAVNIGLAIVCTASPNAGDIGLHVATLVIKHDQVTASASAVNAAFKTDRIIVDHELTVGGSGGFSAGQIAAGNGYAFKAMMTLSTVTNISAALQASGIGGSSGVLPSCEISIYEV